MGCFSFKCLECGRGIRSSSFTGEKCHLFLLKDGKVIQQMTGEYDSYGRVFKDGTQVKDVKHPLRESEHWNQITPFTQEEIEKAESIGVEHTIWHQVTDLMHSPDIKNGIAAVHKYCFSRNKVTPKIRSTHDPDQGWGNKKRVVKNYDPHKEHKLDSIKEELWRLETTLKLNKAMLFLDPKHKRNRDIYKFNKNRQYRLKQKLKQIEKKSP